jgi:hypothetical protein
MPANGFRMAVAVAICLLIPLAGCQRKSSRPSGPLYIMLTFNSGACEQNGSTGIIEINSNQAVVYEGAAILGKFQVQFADCPFASCPVNSPNGTPVNVGAPNAAYAGMTFNYTGFSIDDHPCTNARQLGVRVRPGS